ncbi:MAG: winged helix-turn-helix domain-containing protein [Firmicutes bacterium]|nr:winged helix-turn-helix domain-containing protein [Bacillota bacterium]
MTQKVLVVDDEAHIRELICLYLRQAGFETVEADNGRAALQVAQRERPCLVILDLMLPERDGWEVCRELRARGDTPIIMLTARDAETEKLLGFALGADDYVTKPFQPRELVARVRAVLRRSAPLPQTAASPGLPSPGSPAKPAPGETVPAGGAGGSSRAPEEGTAPQRVAPILDFGSFRLNRLSRELEVHGRVVNCPTKEFDLLWLLASHPNRVFSREELLERVWGYQYFGDLRTVDVHVRRIRQKIEPRPDEPRYLLTVWGVGYKFKPGSGTGEGSA